MRRAVRRCPTHRTATPGRQRRNRPGPCRRFRRRPTPAARWPRRADTDRTARPPSRNRQPRCVSADRSTRPVAGHHGGEGSAAAPPLQLAVVRHGSGHRPAMRHGARTPAVRSTASGPVGVHWQNDQQPCPSRLRQKGRSGCVQAAVMEPVGGHLTAAGRHPAWTPRPPTGRSGRTQDRPPQAADGQSADRSGSLQLPLLFLKAGQRAAASFGRSAIANAADRPLA